MRKKIISLLLVLSMSVTVFAGCGSDADKTNDVAGVKNSSEKSVNAGETVSFTGWYTEENMAPIVKAANEYLDGEYILEYTFVALGDYNNVLSTQLASGEGPDIITDGTDFPARIRAGNLLDISDEAYLERFSDAGLVLTKTDEGIYGVPSYGWFSGNWYNKDMFKAAGITDVPSTLDELLEACAKLKESGVTPLSMGLADANTAAQSLFGYMENVFYNNNDSGFGTDFDIDFANGDEVLDGNINEYVEKWYQLIEQGYINDTMLGVSTQQALQNFMTGKSAIYCGGGPWDYDSLKKSEINFGMFAHPGDQPGNNYLLGGAAACFGINVNAKNESGAQKALEALASLEVQQAFVDSNAGGFSYCKGIESDIPEEYNEVKDALNKGNVGHNWQRWSVNMPAESLFNEAVSQLQSLIAGSITVDEFVKNLDQKADSLRYE